jgi:nucleoside-diphosphate-sugar epimerase
MIRHVVVTGANGFVGKAVSRELLRRGESATGIVRQGKTAVDGIREWVYEGSEFEHIDEQWPSTLHCEAIIHLAARVHVMQETGGNPLAAYRAMNVAGTMRVAQAARRAGARRFVFVSSIKAVGERSSGAPISERDEPAPLDPYGVSKLEAERALVEYGRESGLEIVIVRPPLVYGPEVRANFLRLMRAIASGVPLPLGAISARRSMVFVNNLANAIVSCTSDPRAAGQTFHVADERDLAINELASILTEQLHAPRRLWPVPASWLHLAGRMTARSDQVDRLVGELRVDSSRIREVLGWAPPYTVEEGLSETAAWYRSTH